MAIANIANGESGLSTRGKINSVIDEVSPIEAAAEGSVFQKGATLNEALSREDFGAQKEVFEKSMLAGLVQPSKVWFYHADNFNDATSYSGSPIVNAGTFGRSVAWTEYPNNASSLNFGFNASLIYNSPTGTEAQRFGIYVDDDNHLIVQASRDGVRVQETITGTTTEILNVTAVSTLELSRIPIVMNVSFNSNQRVLNVSIPQFNIFSGVIYTAGTFTESTINNILFTNISAIRMSGV